LSYLSYVTGEDLQAHRAMLVLSVTVSLCLMAKM